jgi:hypothetical protein
MQNNLRTRKTSQAEYATQKKLVGRSKQLAELKTRLKLTLLQKKVLPGLLLGDAHLSTWNNKTYRLHLYQSIKHKEYLYHLYSIFKELCLSEPTIITRTHTTGLCKGQTHQIISFKTMSTDLFRFYALTFIKSKTIEDRGLTKKVPKLIIVG